MAANSLALYEIQERKASKSWLAVLSMIEPSVEHSKKPTSTLIWASFSFFWTLIRGHTERVISVRV